MPTCAYQQVASRDDLPAEVRRAALAAFVGVHERAIVTLRSRAFTSTELRAMQPESDAAQAASSPESVARTKP